ncbi:MAG: hypothetical protein BWZ10_02004 [candidate division BRC1 bacterium ADurb.BinA364]|nr:MAG: hypothetical protein BWZ10_02004 [candidate division BRC1 bacterium ADurb.BinA364]
MLQIAVAHGMALADRLVHQRLGEHRLVAFVVAAAAIAIHVDDHVALKGLAKFHRQVHGLGDRLGILAVDVKNRNLQHARHVGGVDRRAALARIGGEADLVVDHDVQRAADRIGFELAQIERLLDDALADERGVAMDDDGHSLLAALVAQPVLLGPHPAEHDRADVFQMAGIETQRQVNRAPRQGRPIVVVAQVVFDIVAADVQLRLVILEFAENFARAFAHDVGQHIEPAAVRHAQHDLAHPVFARLLDRQIEQRNQAFGAFERETFGAGEVALDELFEDRRVGQAGQDAQLRLARQLQAVQRRFHSPLQPLADRQIVDVHELRPDAAAIRGAQAFEDFAPLHRPAVAQRSAGEGQFHILVGQAVIGRLELRNLGRGHAERIEPRHDMAAHAMVADQLVDVVLQGDALVLARTSRPIAKRASEEPRRLDARRPRFGARSARAECLEKGAPFFWSALRIGAVFGEKRLEELRAQRAWVGIGSIHRPVASIARRGAGLLNSSIARTNPRS